MTTSGDKRMEPLALPYYEAMAEQYAAAVDGKPHNAFYDRPACVSLLPPLAGLAVLDAGCGSGWYSEHLAGRGAAVTAVDVSPKMARLTKARLGDRARVREHDLSQKLDFAEDSAFDLVLCPLVMHYIDRWEPVFSEFHRVLKPGGTFVFSTHHPFMDYSLFPAGGYFALSLIEDVWSTGKVRYYRRPLTAMVDALTESRFAVDRIVEPRPTEDFRRADPEGYERLMNNPWFIVFRALRNP
jgi:SAM-dependent methyltransferase